MTFFSKVPGAGERHTLASPEGFVFPLLGNPAAPASRERFRPLYWIHSHPESQCWVPPMSAVTRILSAMEQGDPHAAEQLLPLVYDELRQLAAAKLVQEKPRWPNRKAGGTYRHEPE